MTRTALITGGGTGIGLAVARRLALAGDSVVITGRRLDPLRRAAAELGDRVRPIGCDHTDPDQLAALLDRLPGQLDVLVNNAGPGGSVVHIGSIAADKGAGAYGAAKAGLASWNIDLARELGARQITANVVAAGFIQDTEFFRGRLSDTRRERLIADTATGRPGMVEDIADTVLFLTSRGARHITGQVLNVNGGAHPTR
ncbi:MAG TPA: SDR family oxidoreductase [Mycobacteriales bacterium]|jgi:3-oxoacyl-[acyl-carrier protein] reductase|nr:SDR family oxidoreductase [Mycobacteriales bacterium]